MEPVVDNNNKDHDQNVFLSPSDIQAALEFYIENNRPDPIVERDMRSWSMEWIPAAATTKSTGHKEKEHAHRREGRLIWKSTYTTVILQSECTWNVSSSSSAPQKERQQQQQNEIKETLDFIVRVFLVEFSKNDASTTNMQFKRMRQRLVKDTEISRIMHVAHEYRIQQQANEQQSQQQNQKSRQLQTKNKLKQENKKLERLEQLLLCEAHIEKSGSTACEERANSNARCAEAIRRAIGWSPSDSHHHHQQQQQNEDGDGDDDHKDDVGGTAAAGDAWMDVIDWISQVLLPIRRSSTSTSTNRMDGIHKLAHRAQLLIMEDAMAEACEQEGDNQIIEVLNIRENTNISANDNDNNNKNSDDDNNQQKEQTNEGNGKYNKDHSSKGKQPPPPATDAKRARKK